MQLLHLSLEVLGYWGIGCSQAIAPPITRDNHHFYWQMKYYHKTAKWLDFCCRQVAEGIGTMMSSPSWQSPNGWPEDQLWAKRCQKNHLIAVQGKKTHLSSHHEVWEKVGRFFGSQTFISSSWLQAVVRPPCLRVVPATNRNVPEDPCKPTAWTKRQTESSSIPRDQLAGTTFTRCDPPPKTRQQLFMRKESPRFPYLEAPRSSIKQDDLDFISPWWGKDSAGFPIQMPTFFRGGMFWSSWAGHP